MSLSRFRPLLQQKILKICWHELNWKNFKLNLVLWAFLGFSKSSLTHSTITVSVIKLSIHINLSALLSSKTWFSCPRFLTLPKMIAISYVHVWLLLFLQISLFIHVNLGLRLVHTSNHSPTSECVNKLICKSNNNQR